MKRHGQTHDELHELPITVDNSLPDNTVYILPRDLKAKIALVEASERMWPGSPEVAALKAEVEAEIRERAAECAVIKNVGIRPPSTGRDNGRGGRDEEAAT